MRVRVRLFAVAKQVADRDSIELELADPATVADVRSGLIGAVPQLSSVASTLQFAVDAEFAAERTPVSASSDVACIPPVSGG